jgi:hypothetical protein
MNTTIIYAILILLTSLPIAYLLNYLTSDEKDLIKYYFPVLLWILVIISTIFYTTNIKNGFITTYMFVTLLIWYKLSK